MSIYLVEMSFATIRLDLFRLICDPADCLNYLLPNERYHLKSSVDCVRLIYHLQVMASFVELIAILNRFYRVL
jgi:hypothetical protein